MVCNLDGSNGPILAIEPIDEQGDVYIQSITGSHMGNTVVDCDGKTYTIRFCVVGVIDPEVTNQAQDLWCCFSPEQIYDAILLAQDGLDGSGQFFGEIPGNSGEYYNDKLPLICDSAKYCNQRNSGFERAISFSLVKRSRDCLRLYWDVTFTDRLVGGERAYQLSDPSNGEAGYANSSPIYNLESLNFFSTRVKVNYSPTKRLVESAQYQGNVNLTSCDADVTCDGCDSAPLLNKKGQWLIPQDTAGTAFVPGLTADDSQMTFTFQKPFEASNLCLLDSWTDVVNTQEFWIIEYPFFNGINLLPQKCYRVARWTAKTERPTIEEVKFCCQTINMVTITMKIKHQRCKQDTKEGQTIDFGWFDLAANIGKEEWDCNACNTKKKTPSFSNRGLQEKRWLDACGKLIPQDMASGGTNATGKQIHTMWMPYRMDDFPGMLNEHFGLAVTHLQPKGIDICECEELSNAPVPPQEGGV